ncbi:hypothetical protein K440DRAFT_662078 [Wilcoxina mikolae CBS 423.85]|nr:hypothetical protein K440DRAFT_662078 [Wilcoxina mikolae CBS 423.85]
METERQQRPMHIIPTPSAGPAGPVGPMHPQRPSLSPIQTFFTSYLFPPPPAGVHPHTHFLTLVSSRGWVSSSRTHRRATTAFNAALLSEFTARFGNDPNPPLETWQRLCAVLIPRREVPRSITQCKKVVKRTHVNLVDLMAGVENVWVFRNRGELEEYTRETGRYFPRRDAKGGGGLVRCLLREIPKEEQEAAAETAGETGEPSERL